MSTTITNETSNNEQARPKQPSENVSKDAKPGSKRKVSKLGSREAIMNTNISRNNSVKENELKGVTDQFSDRTLPEANDLPGESQLNSREESDDAREAEKPGLTSTQQPKTKEKVKTTETQGKKGPGNVQSKDEERRNDDSQQAALKNGQIEHKGSKARLKTQHKAFKEQNKEEVGADGKGSENRASNVSRAKNYSMKSGALSMSKNRSGLSQSQKLMQREYLYLQEFDELNYLEQKLLIVEADKLKCKQRWKELEHEADELKAKIHSLKTNKSIDKLARPDYQVADHINLIRTLNAEKRKRDEQIKRRAEKDKEKQLIGIRELEQKEKRQREQLLMAKRTRMKENIEGIKKRGMNRKKEVVASSRLVKDLLGTTSSNVNGDAGQSQLKVSGLYKF